MIARRGKDQKMGTMPPNMQPQPSQPKKTSPLVWILGGIAVLFFGGMITCGIVGYMAMRVVKNAGFDPDLMKRNPAIAMVKMATALNKDLELVSSNERTGTVTMRDKRTGKTVTYRYDQDARKLEIVGDNGESMTMSSDGNKGTMTVKTAEGTVKYGAQGGSAPSWVPVYPGTTPQVTLSAETNGQKQNNFTFTTKDAVAKVVDYYQAQLKAGGMKVNVVSRGDDGGMVQAGDDANKRTVIVTIGSSAGETTGAVMSIEK
jgi:hypothetical protein